MNPFTSLENIYKSSKYKSIGPNYLFNQTSSRSILLDVQQNLFLLDVQQQKNILYQTSSRKYGLVHDFPRPQKYLAEKQVYWKSSRMVLLDVQQILLDVYQSRRFGGLCSYLRKNYVSTHMKIETTWNENIFRQCIFRQVINNIYCQHIYKFTMTSEKFLFQSNKRKNNNNKSRRQTIF